MLAADCRKVPQAGTPAQAGQAAGSRKQTLWQCGRQKQTQAGQRQGQTDGDARPDGPAASGRMLPPALLPCLRSDGGRDPHPAGQCGGNGALNGAAT